MQFIDNDAGTDYMERKFFVGKLIFLLSKNTFDSSYLRI